MDGMKARREEYGQTWLEYHPSYQLTSKQILFYQWNLKPRLNIKDGATRRPALLCLLSTLLSSLYLFHYEIAHTWKTKREKHSVLHQAKALSVVLTDLPETMGAVSAVLWNLLSFYTTWDKFAL